MVQSYRFGGGRGESWEVFFDVTANDFFARSVDKQVGRWFDLIASQNTGEIANCNWSF